MAKTVPFFFSAFCSLMVGSTVLRTSAGVAFAGVGASAADKAQMIVAKLGSAAGFTAPEIAPNLEPVSSGAGFTQVNFQTSAETDPVTIGIAQAVSTRGDDGQFPVSRIRDLSIPYTGNAATIRAKKVSRTVLDQNGVNRVHSVWVFTTDRRYVVYHRTTAVELGVSVDEGRTILGGRMWHIDGTPGNLPEPVRAKMAEMDRAYWSEQLNPTRTASSGL